MSPQVQVILIAAGCTGAVGCIGVGALWLLRRASLRLLLQVSSAIGVLAVVAGTLGTANAMFISHHDLGVVCMVCLVAGLVAVGFSWLLGRQVEQSSLALRRATRSLGQAGGEFSAPVGPMAAELAALSRELDATAAKLRESRDRERRMEQSRRRLIAWVSHDLRTPLAGLRAMAESLEDGIATDTGRYHRQMRAEVTRLSAMVDDLFELSRIESGTLTLSPDEVEVGDLVSDAVAGMEAVARERSVRLTGEADGPLVIQADPRKLSRALSNLLANAVRHTPAGGRVHVAATAAGDGVVMTVSDGCGGIPDDDLARVFDPSWRGTAARTPGADSGAGLGLAIVRGIVEAHQGQVSVVNAGHGCRFEMRLPLPAQNGNGAVHSTDHAAVEPVGARPAGSLIPDS
ncbi:MAG TPA: HAMP domain-containing sensor histidine kinase [Trebonia sp.]|jgi:signal transduction histidine kinase|nr:HAMP domain-containing sensor histidine kinase [Trebonia sp.]